MKTLSVVLQFFQKIDSMEFFLKVYGGMSALAALFLSVINKTYMQNNGIRLSDPVAIESDYFTKLKYFVKEMNISKSLATLFLLLSLAYAGEVAAQCPTIQFVDLRGTPGFPQTDDLNVCGEPDTLSILIFTDAPGQVKGFEFTVNMVSGMRYAGFEEAHYGGCTSLSNTNPDINSPEFIATGITCGDIFTANIGVTADCSVDLANNEYLIEIEYSYTYFPPTGGFVKCSGVETLGNDFNGALKVPVLNMFTPSPIDVTVRSLAAPTCQTFTISQDGLQAYLDEFKFAVCGIDMGAGSPLSVSSMTANGMDLLGNAVYNPADTTLTACIDNSFFANNGSPNANGAPDQFDTAERMSFEVCYEVANCPSGADIPFSYKAWYGCFDEICLQTGQASFLKVRPSGSQLPTITASLDNGIEICGEDAKVSATVANPNTDTDQNLYSDVSIGFQACGMETFNITDVMINGVSVPPLFEIIGDDINIDLSMNTDPNIGLVDYDGDGFLDDLPGGAAPLDIMVSFSLACGVGSEGGCPEINCPNVQFYLKGKTNCGNNFQGFPPTGGFNLQYGQEDVSNPGEDVISGTTMGYDFGRYSNDGAPIGGTNSSEITVEFCYEFAQENIADCPSGGETKMVAHFGGPTIMIADLEVVPGTVMMDDGSGYVAVPDGDVTLTPTSAATATLEINAGSNNPTLCYRYNLRLDDCHCGPAQFIAVDQQIVSVCSDCTPDCEIVKGCRSTLLRADPQCTPCPCMAQYVPVKTERKNLGYVDKAMTQKITREELIAAGGAVDLSRFMPGDTLWHQGYWELLDEDLLGLADPARWTFTFRMQTLGGSSSSGEVQAALPLTWEAGSMILNEMRIENPDGTVHIVDISSLPACAVDATAAVPSFNSFDTHWETPWGDDPNSAYACTTTFWEGWAGNATSFDLYNFDRMEEINSINPAIGARHTWGTGDCLTEFIETYGLGAGSQIHFDFCAPMIKNPLREMAKILGEAPPEATTVRITEGFTATPFDEIAGSGTFGWGANENGCQESVPFEVSCPGGIKSETHITIDNCGGTVEHAFVVDAFAGPPGDEWFTHEYRPLIELHDIEMPVISPLAYCNSAEIIQNGNITPVVVDSTINMACSPVAGFADDLCAVDEGTTGAIVMDLFDQVGGQLGIGLDNCDTLKIVYDYCMICPEPIEGLLEYELKVDWCYPGGLPNQCQIDASTFYNPRNTGGASTLGDEASAQGFVGNAWHRVNYYNLFSLDSIYCKLDDTQGVVFIDDQSTPTMPVTAANADGSGLIVAGSPGTSIEVKEVEFCNPDPMDATGFSGYVTVPNAVLFQGVCLDAAGSMPLTAALVSDDGQEKKYQVDFPTDVLATGDCVSVFVKTTLLFCPTPGSLPPEICTGASSGCSPAEVRTAIGGSGACSSSEVCYAYIFGEADLQTEWFSFPECVELCSEVELFVRVKNVKDLPLLDLVPNFTLPFGMSVVPGSWEVAYPGGTVDMQGNFGPWTSVPDPDDVSGLDYSWSDDALWNADIDMNGLPGVSAALDSNNVSFRFLVTTNCDEFLSGSKPSTETQTADPCGPEPLSSGIVDSPALIVKGADPADFAQILAVGSPSELYCGGLDNLFGLTALNVSDKPTTDSVVTCLLIPGDYLDYVSGSVMFTNGFMPAWMTETPIGNDIQVCFHSPDLQPGEAWSVTFEAAMKPNTPCVEIPIGADIKSVVESATCVPGPPDECDVFVQNSLNPVILVDLKAPIKTEGIRVSADCTASEDPMQVCYEVDLSNPGPAYSGNIRIGIHDDVTANGTLETFDTELNGMDHAVSLAPGEMITLSMCLDVAAIQSCPIIIKQTYETDCSCDSEETPIMDLSPSFIADLQECVVLCPTQPLELETCGGYDVTLEPAAGGVITDDGTGNLSIVLNDGFGIPGTDPVKLVVTGTTGECEIMDMVELKSLGDWVPTDKVADICENDCVDLDLEIPAELEDGATITWTPALGLDDPTSATPELCDLTADQVYNVEIAFGESCVFNIEYEVTYNPNGVTTISGEEFCLCQEAGTLTGQPGFASYEWYSIQSGAEILEALTTTNTWNGPTEAGDYFLKAYLPGAICPNVSNVVTLEGKECVDLELTKEITNIPTPVVLGSQITYEITVCNIADEDLGLKFDATNVEVSDELPGAVTYVQHTQTSGNYSPTTNQWDITTLANGTCETLSIDVTIDETGTIENTAQVSGADQEDIDSTPNNDDGDQSEDEEDNAVIEVVCESLSGEIFYDNDNDGCQDEDEGLVMETINVSLYECGAEPGTDPPVAMTQVMDGEYEFGVDSEDVGADLCLQAGTEYFVVFDIPNAANQALEDYTFSEGVADPTCQAAGDSDDVDPATGASDCYDPSDSDAGDGDGDNNINAGITPPCYEMAGEIFYDDNNDGCQDPGEGLVDDADIEVSIYECGDVPGVDQPAATTTVSDGMYEFGPDSDDPGADICLENDTEYFVVFDIPNAVGESLEEYTFSENDASGACAVSGESDNVDPATGASGCFDPDDDDSSDGDDDQNVDAGITPPCETLGGEIFYDTNGNGCEDGTESLVMEPINVMLFECGDDPSVDPPAASTTVTDGEYEFGPDSDDPGAEICLEPGTQYFVVFDIPMGAGEVLDGYEFTQGTASASCAATGGADDVDPSTGQSGCFDPNDDDAADGNDDNSIDAGITPPCEMLGGEIFYDYDDDGCQDSDEMLVMMDVNVSLYECGDTPGVDAPVAATTVSDGEYMFGEGVGDPGADVCLEAGTEYFVVFDLPNAPGEDLEGYEFSSGTADPACALSGDSDDIDPTTGASGCHDPADDDSGDGDGDNNIDAGITPPCESLGGEIFYDDDMDGCEDSNESLVTEVVGVMLYECGQTPGVDAPTASTFTNDGMYEFGPDSDDPGADVCLMPGTQYFVVFDIPNGAGETLEDHMITMGMADAGCEALGESSDVDPTTGQSGCYDPNDNDSGDGNGDSNIDLGISPPCESLGGEIFYDDNRDGCQDDGESLVMEDIDVTLYECGDVPGVSSPVASTTVSDGEYEFGIESDDPGADVCLDPNTEYFVVFDIPNAPGEALDEYSFTEGTADPACAASGDSDDVDPATGATDCENPSSDDGDADDNMNAGITPPCEELGGEIFYDGNENGCQDPNEMLVMEPINVTLYECGDVPGVDPPAASTTVTDGEYEFGPDSDDPGADICLEPDTEYFVVFDMPNAIGEVLEEYEFTSGTADPACEAAGDSSDVDPSTGATACEDPGADNGDSNMDAGITPPCEQISGEIFYDLDENGCQDMGESLVTEDINVSLYECGDDPAVDFPVASTTVSDGMYAFGETSDDPGADVCLEAGTEYFVVFDIPSAPGDPLEGFEFTMAPLNPSCAIAGESDDVNPATGQSACYDPNNEDGEDGDADENVDAGIVPPCEEIAGEIFIDENDNGCQDPGESLVMTNVTVSLYECGDTPGVDVPAAITMVTDGQYEFGEDSDDPGADICLAPNVEYFVHFDIPNGIGESLEEYAFSEGEADPACEAAGSSDDVDPATGSSECLDPSGDDDDSNVDAGIVPPCESLGGEIFVDENRDGCEDPGESLAMFDIEVSLYECGDVPGVDQPLASTIVSDGEYEFGEDSDDPGADVCLEAGTEYFVAFDLPNGPGEAAEDYGFTEGVASGDCAAAGESDNVDPATGTSSCHDPNDDDAGDGDDDENIDAGISPPCESLGGEIFYDDNANGCQDGGESLVMESINVMLFECGQTPGVDAPVASTNVADGMYEFGEDSDDPGADVCLEAGTEYFVVFDIPMGPNEVLDGFEFTDGMASATCMGAGQSDDVDPTTGASGCYDPNDDDGGDGDGDSNIDAGITAPCESLAGEIFIDANNDGCEDATEPLATFDIEVSLYECGDTPGVDQPIASTTVSDGEYEFGIDSDDPGADVCLQAGTEYFVAFDLPNAPGEAAEGFEFTSGTASGACEAAGESDNVDPTTGASGCYDPSDDDAGDGDDDNNIDAGISPPCESLGGEIFYDDNGNGCQDGSESLVTESINVMLFECGQTPGVDAPIATTNISDGMYMFGMGSDDPGANMCLDSGTEYFVVFDIPMGPNEVLDGFEFTDGMASATCMGAGQSNDADPTTGASGCFDPNDDDGVDGDGDNNIDAGITAPCESIAGEIFYDDNDNGCQDPDETLVDDQTIEVVLYECGDVPGLDQPAAFTSTSDGQYEFGIDSDDPGADICLDANTEYFVEFHIPNGPGEPLEDYYFSSNTAAPSCLFSGEGDNVDPNTGTSSCHNPSDDDAGDGDGDNNIDAGIMHPCEILGGEIFYDYDNDGCHDDSESLVTDPVNVTLYECGDDPATATPVASTTTTDGTYQFGDEYSQDSSDDPCLNPRREYFVVFDFPSAPGDPLEDHYFSDGEADAACTAAGGNDDVHPDTGESACYNPDNDDDDRNIDAGITPCEEISGEVFYDWNADGCQDDASEGPVPGIDVYIFECGETNPTPGNALASTSTNGDGEYAFGPEEEGTAEVCLHPDREYFVLFDIPNGDGEQHEDFFPTDGDGAACAGGDAADDTDPTTGATGCVDPDDDDDDDDLNMGITPCEEIGGEVYVDNNRDGCQEDGVDAPVPGVNVYVFECGTTDTSPANALASDVTNDDGEYDFGPEEEGSANVCLDPAKEYFVVFDIPTATGEQFDDFALTSGDSASCAGGDNGDDVDPATGASACFGPDGDDDDEHIDAGIMPCEEIAGEVFYDDNADGCQEDGTEEGVPGVDVYLFECGATDTSPANAAASTTTDDDGAYKFGSGEEGNADICLDPNKEYFVVFDLPNGDGEALDGFEFTDGDSAACAGSPDANDVDPATGQSDCYNPQDDDGGDGDGDENIDAGIMRPVDIALRKTVSTPGPYTYGQLVTFDIELINQGALDLYNVVVNDFIPCGYAWQTTGNAGWTFDPLSSVAQMTVAGPIAGMTTQTVTITLAVQACSQAGAFTNVAEVESMQDINGNDVTGDDVDSTGDADPTNDVESDNMTGNEDGDEDDADPASIEIFDLALIKELVTLPMYEDGDVLEYRITVVNQGTISATNIEVWDYLPAGITSDASQNTAWDATSAPNYSQVITSVVAPGESVSVSFFGIINYVGSNADDYVNFAEIGGATDENGGPQTDADSTPDNNPDNDGTPLDNQLTDRGDEDDHDLEGIDLTQEFIFPCDLSCDMQCIGQINLSLDNNCEARLLPSMVIPGLGDVCDDVASAAAAGLVIEIFDENNNLLTDADGNPTNLVTSDYIGQNLTYSVTNNFDPATGETCGNSCWGNVLIEYKLVPQIVCPDTMITTCAVLEVMCLPDLLNVEDNCAGNSFEVFLADEQREVIECGDPRADDYTHIITRTYRSRDNNGGIFGFCEQMIFLQRVESADITYPSWATINCSDLGNFELTEDGCPAPWLAMPELDLEIGLPFTGMGTTGSGTGSGTIAPNICVTGMDQDPDNQIVPLFPGTGSTCNGFVTFTDVLLPDVGCSKKFIRTWEIFEWNCGVEELMSGVPQVIEVIDDQAPVIDVCPPDFEVTTNDNCAGDIELPLPQASDACNNGINVTIQHPFGLVEVQDGVTPTATLETGKHRLEYTVSDDCYNINTECIAFVTVRDNTQPIAICEQTTVVSISQDGNTIVSSDVFDDGSWDECGPVTTCATKMEDLILFRSLSVDTIVAGTNYVLKSRVDNGCLQQYIAGIVLDGVEYLSEADLCVPYVRFCCTNVGVDQMVVFRAIDGGGNTSDCMVNVEVQDKSIPNLTCPEDVTIDCRVPFDLNFLGFQFGNYTIDDNCGDTQQVDTLITPNLNQCGQGSITREFSISSFGLVVMSCKQEITIINEAPFTVNDIIWPLDFDAACGTASTLTPEAIALNPDLGENFARPSFSNSDNCSLLGYDFEDEFFASDPISQECGVINRIWTAIDWCTQRNGTFATFQFTQTIKIEDNIAPVLDAVSDTTIMSSNASCTSVELSLSRTVGPDCTPFSSLNWNNQLMDATGTSIFNDVDGNPIDLRSSNLTATLAAGTYSIVWSVSDGCGNTTTDMQNLTILNTKLPIPICRNGIAVSLDSHGEVELWASDIDGGSYHPCGPQLGITLSFNAAGTQSNMLLSCDPNETYPVVMPVSLYVIDNQTGLGDFCVATVEVQDPTGACSTSQKVTLSGDIKTETQQSIEEVKVELTSTTFDMTDGNGNYAFADMPIGGDYNVAPVKNDDHMNGVSTLDLIIIQRHILGIETLDSPYQLLAADVNSSEGVNGIDLVELRKLILGIYTEFPDNTSWRFVDAEYQFADAHNPWLTQIAETYDIVGLSSDMDIDFVGVKVGDVNGDIAFNAQDQAVDTRSQGAPLVMEYDAVRVSKGEEVIVPFYFRNYEQVSGWQTTMEWNKDLLEVMDLIDKTPSNPVSYNLGNGDKGILTMSQAGTSAEDKSSDEVIFELRFKAKEDVDLSTTFVLSSSVTTAEAYRGYSDKVELRLDTRVSEESQIISVTPNPWITMTEVNFYIAQQGKGIWEFYDVNGRMLHRATDQYAAGYHTMRLSRNQIDGTGVIYAKLTTDQGVAEYKMILVD